MTELNSIINFRNLNINKLVVPQITAINTGSQSETPNIGTLVWDKNISELYCGNGSTFVPVGGGAYEYDYLPPNSNSGFDLTADVVVGRNTAMTLQNKTIDSTTAGNNIIKIGSKTSYLGLDFDQINPAVNGYVLTCVGGVGGVLALKPLPSDANTDFDQLYFSTGVGNINQNFYMGMFGTDATYFANSRIISKTCNLTALYVNIENPLGSGAGTGNRYIVRVNQINTALTVSIPYGGSLSAIATGFSIAVVAGSTISIYADAVGYSGFGGNTLTQATITVSY
jgi:hypothetical protein